MTTQTAIVIAECPALRAARLPRLDRVCAESLSCVMASLSEWFGDTPSLAAPERCGDGAAWCLWVREAELAAQVGQDCQHPPVVLGCGREAELAEDAGDVLFDGALGDDELVRDPLVGAALGDQLQHLPL